MIDIFKKMGITPGPLELKKDWWIGKNGKCIATCAKNMGTLFSAAPEMLEALICQKALDLPIEQGYTILEFFGWSRADRLELSETDFVKKLINVVLEKATDGRIKRILKTEEVG